MTRNSQDDLLIFAYLITKYVCFLQQRLSKEYELLENEYATLLPYLNDEYLCTERIFHLDSTKDFMSFLDEIQKKVFDFYTKNQRPLPLYSIECYHANIQKNKEEIIKIINSLFEN